MNMNTKSSYDNFKMRIRKKVTVDVSLVWLVSALFLSFQSLSVAVAPRALL